MKHIRILYIILLAAGMSSCSMLHQSATTRTARSFEIDTDIKQMPTVADLVVDSIYAREDTTWTNILFKYTVTKANMRDVLIGEILEQNNADVLVQPREKITNTIHHPFKQTYSMEIFGYPARYRNFRTATEEDIRILNGIDPQPVNYNTIYIGGGFTGQPVAGAYTQAITEMPVNKAKKDKKPPFVRNNYIGTVEFGYNWFPGFTMRYGGHGFMINTNHLFKTKNPNIYQGFGIGLNANFGQYDSDNDAREWFIPIYYTPRFYFAQRKCIPFFDFRIGAFMAPFEWNHNNNWGNKEIDFAGGLYYAAFLGMEFGKHVDIAFGTDQFFGGATSAMGYSDEHLLFTLNLVVKMAVCF